MQQGVEPELISEAIHWALRQVSKPLKLINDNI